jgi:serine/threonine protein kinase
MEYSSKLYNSDGDIIDINETINGTPFFRKEFYSDSANERDIVRLIKRCDFTNIVKIYYVEYKYYDSEMLLTPIMLSKENVNQIINDMRNAKLELQSKGIIYIDWKLDNIGFSIKDNVYKLFDFDSSGIISNNCKEWIKPAPHRWIYKKSFEKGLSFPLDIDNYCFDLFCEEVRENFD